MDSEFIIRRIRPDEHERATLVWQRGWESAGVTHPNDLTYEELLDRFKSELEQSWDLQVADHQGQIVGLLALKPSLNRIDQLFVAPEYQSRGVGRRLLEFAKIQMPKEIWLRTAEKNARAIAFYTRAGFSIDRVEARPEWDRNDVVMVWRGP